jgi:hypothetical protein
MSLAAPYLLVTALVISETARIEYLIERLGSEFYAERQSATRELAGRGFPALQPVRDASQTSGNPEIRRRAEGLIRTIERRCAIERALAIRRSNLKPEEKAEKLKPLLDPGISRHEVIRLLGQPTAGVRFVGESADYYPDYGLSIYYNRDFKVEQVR